MKKYIILFVTVSIIFMTFSLYAAEKIVDYGFEDWGGDIDDTPGYIVCTDYKTEHETSSEVITSYNANEMSQTWTPHSGNYYFFQNGSQAGSYPLDPAVDGITDGSVYSRMNVGISGSFCPQAYDFATDITTGETFIRVWFRFNKGFGNIGGKMKLLRIYANTRSAGDTVYMHLSTRSISPDMYFYCSNEGGWIGTSYSAMNAYDGNWHKFSFYVNWNTGVMLGWYDIDVEKPENAVKSYTAGDSQLGNGIRPSYAVLKSNYSATYPTEETYYGMDDIEIWDGLPIPPDAPKNLRIVE